MNIKVILELRIATVSNKAYLHKDILVPVACQHLFILLPNSREDIGST